MMKINLNCNTTEPEDSFNRWEATFIINKTPIKGTGRTPQEAVGLLIFQTMWENEDSPGETPLPKFTFEVAPFERRPYAAVDCPHCGRQVLGEEEYSQQLSCVGEGWNCPRCGEMTSWNDEVSRATNPDEIDDLGRWTIIYEQH